MFSCPWDATYEECRAVIDLFHGFIRDETGATAVEYGLIAALVSLSAGGVVALLGDVVQLMYDLIATSVQAAPGAS